MEFRGVHKTKRRRRTLLSYARRVLNLDSSASDEAIRIQKLFQQLF